ncbi:MAG: hypothetical protein K2I19_08705, partial [Muribaculaceae bacterium]|nr:hypothetical protein [Muribaculaceae bacterium]
MEFCHGGRTVFYFVVSFFIAEFRGNTDVENHADGLCVGLVDQIRAPGAVAVVEVADFGSLLFGAFNFVNEVDFLVEIRFVGIFVAQAQASFGNGDVVYAGGLECRGEGNGQSAVLVYCW